MTDAVDGGGAGQLWRRFSRHGVAYLAGEIGGRGLSYLILILLAPLMSLEDFGYVNLFLTLVGLLTVLASLGLPDAVVRFYYLDEPLDRIIGSAVLLIAIGSLALGVVVFAARRPMTEFLHVPAFVVVLSLACAPVTAVRQAWLEVFRARQRVRNYALARLAEPLILIGVVLLLLVRFGSPGYRSVLLAYGGSTAAVALVGLVMLSRRPGLRGDVGVASRLLAYSAPLVAHSLAMAGLATYDQIVINQVLGASATGLYAYAYRFGMSMSLVATGFQSAWVPLMLEKLQRGSPGDMALVAQRYVRRGLVVGGALCLVLPPLALWLGGPGYRETIRLIPIIVYGYVWAMLYHLASAYLVYENRTLAVAACSGITALASAALNYTLVPAHGLLAASAITVASYALLYFLVWLQIRRAHRDIRFGGLVAEVLLFAPVPAVTSWLSS